MVLKFLNKPNGWQVDQAQGGPRYKEDVVWHGTRLKRASVQEAAVIFQMSQQQQKEKN